MTDPLVCLAAALMLLTTAACDPVSRDTKSPKPSPIATEAPTQACHTAGSPEHRAKYAEGEAVLALSAYPFSPGDGPKALAWLAEAAACQRNAGSVDAAAQLQARGARLRQRIEDDYRILRLRLGLALAQERKQDAARDAGAILSLLASAPSDPFIRWLQRLQRRLR